MIYKGFFDIMGKLPNLQGIIMPRTRKTTTLTMSKAFRSLPFWDRVNAQLNIEENGCHIFTGHKDECGYGRLMRDGKLVRLHRAQWEKHFGPIPEKGVIMHSCDNPACINIDHLSLGTQLMNIRDMWKKKRAVLLWGNTHTKGKNINVGQSHGLSVFNDEMVKNIKKELQIESTWKKVCELANKYKVSKAAIQHIRKGTRWSHISVKG